MFTGLIEEKGFVLSLMPGAEGKHSNLELEIACKLILEDIKLGDSIAIDGVCQTVTKITDHSFWVTAIDETLKLTNFHTYKAANLRGSDYESPENQVLLRHASKVNLERCLRPSDRLGGHIVQGHVDGIGTIKHINNLTGSKEFYIEVPTALSKYIVKKGSIAVSGISLTVTGIEENLFSVAIIPKTLELTVLGELTVGSKVNIEVDIMAKHLEKLLSAYPDS